MKSAYPTQPAGKSTTTASERCVRGRMDFAHSAKSLFRSLSRNIRSSTIWAAAWAEDTEMTESKMSLESQLTVRPVCRATKTNPRSAFALLFLMVSILIWKVKHSKISLQFACNNISFFGCDDSFSKHSDMNSLTAETEVGNPSTMSFFTANSNKSGSVIRPYSRIRNIFRMLAYAKIGTTIVESVSVNVIDNERATRSSINDYSVHFYDGMFSVNRFSAASIEPFSVLTYAPLPLRKKVIDVRINDGYMATSEGNVAI